MAGELVAVRRAIAAVSSGNVSSVSAGHEPRARDPLLRRAASRIRADARRGGRTRACDSLTGESPRRMPSDSESWSNVRATVSRGVAWPCGASARPTAGRPPVDFSVRWHDRRLLRDPRRRARRVRGGDQEGLPPARAAVAPGREPGARGGGPVQGDQRGLPGPVRPGAAAALRPVRDGRRGGRRRAPGFGGFADIFDAFFGAAAAGTRRGAAGRPPARDLRYDLRITFEEAILGTQKEIEFPVLGALRDLRRQRREAGHRADHLPAVQRPRRGPRRPPDDARPDDQRHHLPALPGRRAGSSRRRARRARARAASSGRGRSRSRSRRASTRATRSASPTRARRGRAAARRARSTSRSTSRRTRRSSARARS